MFKYFKFNRWVCDPSKSLQENEKALRAKSVGKRQLADNLNTLSRAFIEKDPQEALRLINESLQLVPDVSRKKWYGFRLFENGFVIESYTVLNAIPQENFVSKSENRLFLKISAIYNNILPLRQRIAELSNDDNDKNSTTEMLLDSEISRNSVSSPAPQKQNDEGTAEANEEQRTWSCDLSLGFVHAENSLRKTILDKNLLASYLFELAQIAFDKYPDDALRCVRESVALNYKDYRVLWHVSKLLELQRVEEAYKLLFVIDREHLSSYNEVYKYNGLMAKIEKRLSGMPEYSVRKFGIYKGMINQLKGGYPANSYTEGQPSAVGIPASSGLPDNYATVNSVNSATGILNPAESGTSAAERTEAGHYESSDARYQKQYAALKINDMLSGNRSLKTESAGQVSAGLAANMLYSAGYGNSRENSQNGDTTDPRRSNSSDKRELNNRDTGKDTHKQQISESLYKKSGDASPKDLSHSGVNPAEAVTVNQDITAQVKENAGDSASASGPSLESDRWVDRCLNRMKEIGESNGCKYYTRMSFRVGVVSDILFYRSLSPAADFIYLTRDNYLKVINQGLDCMFFVSTWKGFANAWQGLASDTSVKKVAVDLIEYSKSKGIPVVFIFVGDLKDYQLFLPFAHQCDYIFASTHECLNKFAIDCPNKPLFQYSFCINPHLNNPVGLQEYGRYRESSDFIYVCNYDDNSGSDKEFFDKKQLEGAYSGLSKLFDSVLVAGINLRIISRATGELKPKKHTLKSMLYKKYHEYFHEYPDDDFVQKIPKVCPWIIKTDATLNDRNVLENSTYDLCASGAHIVSRYGQGMNCQYSFVNIINAYSDLESMVNAYANDELYFGQINNIRRIFNKYTCYDRMGEVLTSIGLHQEVFPAGVLVVCEKITESIQYSFNRQTWEHKKLCIKADLTTELIRSFKVITFFDDEFFYEEYYLEDMINAFKYTNCSFITRDVYLDGNHYKDGGVQNNYVSGYRSLFTTVFWIDDFAVEDILMGSFESENGYAVDHFSLIRNYPAFEQSVRKPESFKLSVIIPIYNNGIMLLNKAFASLRRCSMFEDMEILFIDDCSTDVDTLAMESYLARHYGNIKLYRFEGECSGSASRPRNKGVELATAPYLVFLDPDDSACEDGYRYLYEEITETDCDICVGNVYCQKKDVTRFNYFEKVKKYCSLISFEHGLKKYLPALSFMTVRIHAMMIKSSFIKNFSEKQIDGAIGQDSLFSMQMLSSDVFVRFINNYVQIYYANVENSVTNTVNGTFFEKLLILQPHKIKWLKDNNLLVSFMNSKFKSYTLDYLFVKLVGARVDSACSSEKAVYEIIRMYMEYYDGRSQIINDFIGRCQSGKHNEIRHMLQEYYKKRSAQNKSQVKEIPAEM